MQTLEHLWVIVLAAGEGRRLAALTRALHGTAVPKQFAFFSANKRSLVQAAVDRLSPLVPNERIIVVVPAADIELAERQLAANPPISVLAEPQNRGTGPSLLLAVAAVLEKDPAAQVAIVPAAHVVQRPEALLEGILRARAELDSAPITLLAVAASKLEADHSWIMPGRDIEPGIWSVADFAYSPPEHVTRQLFSKGALWDTFCTVAEGSTLWRVSARHLAAQCETIRKALAACTPEALHAGYATMAAADFSHHVVARQLGIAVADVTDSGFSEIATLRQALEAFPGLRDRCKLAEPLPVAVPSYNASAPRPFQDAPAP